MTDKDKNRKKVPNLRFPGFEQEWETKIIKDLGKFVGGGTPNTSNTQFWTGTIPWVSSSDILIDNIHNILKTRFITERAINSSATNLVPKGGILMVSRVGIGKFAVADEELCTSQDFTNLITNENAYFLCYNFSARSNKFIKLSQGTSIKGFTTQDIKSAIFFIPSLKEQNKISRFLSLIDNRLQSQRKTINALKVLKTSLSSKIFSQQLRFKDENGNNFPDWENKKLKDISSVIMGQSPDSSSYNNNNNGVPLIQGNADISNRKSKPRQYTNAPTKLCEVGDILLTVRAPAGYVAKSFHNACIGRGMCSLKNNKLSLSEFLYQFLLKSENHWKSIEQGSTFTSVNSSDICSVKVKVPSISEQQKISNFLSSIDAKIDIENQISQKLEEQKKYFLANLFI